MCLHYSHSIKIERVSQEGEDMKLFNVINILTRFAAYNGTTIVARIRFESLRFNLLDSY